jgi:hypothetical protein
VGQFPIVGTSVQAMEHYKRRDFVLSFTVDGRVRYLCAPSAELMNEWADAIRQEAARGRP